MNAFMMVSLVLVIQLWQPVHLQAIGNTEPLAYANHIESFGTKPDSVFVRDTVRKYVSAMISPRTSLLRRAVETSRATAAIPYERKIVIEHYQVEVADPHYLTTGFEAKGLSPDGAEQTIDLLHIEEFHQIHSHPTLCYVFFDENSSEIPKRYNILSQREARNYGLDELATESDLDVHHNILNLIAQRLLADTDATILLTGCNANMRAERNNLSLSQARASTVKNYLTTVWGIDPSRIATRSRNIPEIASSSKTTEGQEENRRVEISSEEPSITDAFTASDTSRVSNPSVIRFKTSYQSVSPLKSWTLVLAQNGIPVKRFSSTGALPKNIDWDLADDDENLPKHSTPLEATLTLKNSLGNTASFVSNIRTEVRTLQQKRREKVADTTIERYNLVLFSVGKSRLSAAHQRVIAVLKQRMKPNSQILIEGFADESGNSNANAKLAKSRAVATKKALGRRDAIILGAADSRTLHPNDTPEGRFLCRTVRITMRTPTQ